MTWNEIRQHLRGRWNLATDEAEWCGLIVDAQRVAIKPTVGLPRPGVIVAAQVCPDGRIDPRDALRYNGAARRGALMLEGPALVLRQLLPMDVVDVEELDATIEGLMEEATRLRVYSEPEPAPVGEVCEFYGFMAE